MAKDKQILVTERTHEILRRESITLTAENLSDGKEGEIKMKTLIANIAEGIQNCRGFADLPEKDV